MRLCAHQQLSLLTKSTSLRHEEHARGVGSISFTARCFDRTITVRLGNDSVSYFSDMCDEAGYGAVFRDATQPPPIVDTQPRGSLGRHPNTAVMVSKMAIANMATVISRSDYDIRVRCLKAFARGWSMSRCHWTIPVISGERAHSIRRHGTPACHILRVWICPGGHRPQPCRVDLI